ncbi:MAG: hypothetical protein HXY43_00405 [Fischerella sp.]|uniref:hypothetical protein n=1 Tax=Fischerella sp. TaxID=1191 RepID=UPI0017DAA18B|nr:hypothetical protein [Fischerella sp.]NWF57815.1 hypothetical protein [Fischerella sp.]
MNIYLAKLIQVSQMSATIGEGKVKRTKIASFVLALSLLSGFLSACNQAPSRTGSTDNFSNKSANTPSTTTTPNQSVTIPDSKITSAEPLATPNNTNPLDNFDFPDMPDDANVDSQSIPNTSSNPVGSMPRFGGATIPNRNLITPNTGSIPNTPGRSFSVPSNTPTTSQNYTTSGSQNIPSAPSDTVGGKTEYDIATIPKRNSITESTPSIPTTSDRPFSTPSSTDTTSQAYTSSSSQNTPGAPSSAVDSMSEYGSATPSTPSTASTPTTSDRPFSTPTSTATTSQTYTNSSSQSNPSTPSSNVSRTTWYDSAAIPSTPTSRPTTSSQLTTPARPFRTPSGTVKNDQIETNSSNQSNPNAPYSTVDRMTRYDNSAAIPNRSSTTGNQSTTPSRSLNRPSTTTTPSRLPASGVKPVERTSIAATSPSIQEVNYSKRSTLAQSIDDANAVVRGLVVARHEGQIKPYSRTWRKAQDAIILLRQGKTRQVAASRAKVPMPVLMQLIEWGQIRPTISSSSTLPASGVEPVERASIAATSPSIQEVNYSEQSLVEQSIDDANAVARGLVVARHEGQIKPYSRTWRKAQDAIILLRQGKTRQIAASRAKVPMPVLMQLIEWGQNQPIPGNISNLQQYQQ